MTDAETELVLEALAAAAARLEARVRKMAPGAGRHHEERADTMRTLRARLHNDLALARDDDVIMLNVAGLLPAEIDDLRAHVRGKQPGAETYAPPEHGWTCFHCGETFATVWGARQHFGYPKQARPQCIEEPHAAAIARRRSP